jgi:hypothetical protein
MNPFAHGATCFEVIQLGGRNQQDHQVNSSTYGLANSVWSSDLERAGCNLSGCGGGVLGPETLSDYLRNQSVVRALV